MGRHNFNFIFNKIIYVYRMASGSGGNIVGRNPEWRYCTLVEGNNSLMIKSDGITRFKFHLSHTDFHKYKKVSKCAAISKTRNEATFNKKKVKQK